MRRKCFQMQYACFIALILCFVFGNCADYCDGEWLNSSVHDVSSYPIIASRTHIDPADYDTTVNDFLSSACPAQVAHYTCYYHGNTTRAKQIEYRRWILNKSDQESSLYSRCEPFRPVEFLSMLRNKRVFFYGDSVLGNLFISLFCSLYFVSESSYRIHFIKLYSCDHILCPLNGPEHSYNHGDSIIFKEFNVTLFYTIENSMHIDVPQFIIKNHIARDDIIILNGGLHYNDPTVFRNDLKYFYSVLQSTWEQSSNFRDTFPLLLQFESTPQHFPSSTEGKTSYEQGNGYYQQITSSYQGEKKCRPFVDQSSAGNLNTPERRHQQEFAFKQDWRNRIVEEELEPLLRHQATFAKETLKTSNVSSSQLYQQFAQSPTIYRIPIAKGLYDQYDAHLESSPFAFVPFDCTHWCFPSNVDRYMHLMLFNGLRRAMLQRKEAHWLKAVHQLPGSVLKDKLVADTAKENEQSEKDRKWKVYMLPPSVTPGSLVKMAKRSEVYYINDGGEKQVFWSWSAFVSRGFDAGQIMTIAESELVMIPDGEPLT